MVKTADQVSLVYVYIYTKFRKHLQGTPYVRPSYLLEILRRICRIPKILNYPILNEMEKLKLLRRINNQKWEVLRHDCINELKKYHFKTERIPWN